jgi:hypothetical protein
LKVQERYIHEVTEVKNSTGGKQIFYEDGLIYRSTPDTLVLCNGKYYDGRTTELIGTADKINYNFKMKINNADADMNGQDNDMVTTNGRIMLNNLNNVTYLYLGNGLFADIVYQFTTKYYTVEEENHSIKKLREVWENNPDDIAAYEKYYDALINALHAIGGI